jgi:hypothetical protein
MRKSIAVFVVALCAGTAGAKHADQKKTTFGTETRTGFGYVQYHNTCVTFEVWFVSGNFFDGLRQSKTANGVEFSDRNKVIYRTFPDELTVDVEAIPLRCPLQPTEVTPPDYAAGLMSGALFKVAWKQRDEFRPVVLSATQELHHNLSWRWKYVLTVPSKDVPLSDSLVIDVSLRNGLCRTHLTANLNTGLRSPAPSTCDVKE